MPPSSEEREHLLSGARIRALRGKESRAAFSARFGLSPASLFRYERGDRLPETEVLTRIAKAYGTTVEWIVTGDGLTPDGIEVEDGVPEPDSRAARQLAREAEEDGVILVPVYGARPAAGNGSALEDYVEGWHEMTASEARELGLRRKSTAMVRVRGDSMEPTLRDGERVVVDTSVNEISHDAIYVLRLDDTLVVKRAQLLRGGVVRIVSDNILYEAFEVSGEDARQLAVIGRAVHVWRKL